jgi:Flp pilus assembly protein TadD
LLTLEALAPADRVNVGSARLTDPSRAVRIQAAWLLAPARSALSGKTAQDFDRAAGEFIASHRYNADRPESRTTLGLFLAQLERAPEAIAEYRAALRLSPKHGIAYVNLADLYRAQGKEADAERTLREGLAASPDDASLHYALGLSLARSNRNADALAALERAAALSPDSVSFAYGYAVALHSSGKAGDAIRILEQALMKHPRSRDLLFALAAFHRDGGNKTEAIRYARRLSESFPRDADAAALLRSLQ